MLMTKRNRDFFSSKKDVTPRLMIRSGKFLKSPNILSMFTLSASFRNIWLILIKICWWKVKQRIFQQSRERNSKINDLMWPVFKPFRDFIHIHICKFQEDQNKIEWVTLMTKSNRGFFSNQGGRNSKIKDPIWPVFEFVRDFIHV